MCNPRRITVTATQQLAEAWDREVSRCVELSALVEGEARVREALGGTVAAPVLRVVQALLAAGVAGWEPVDGGYRHAVTGGYVCFRPEDQTLEIVAVTSEEVEGMGEASVHLHGMLNREIAVEASAGYYDDAYRGRTQAVAKQEASRAAQEALPAVASRHLKEAADMAERAEESTLKARAETAAQQDLARRARARQRELEERARAAMAEVGAESRRAFHELLALGYRDALLAMARARGASGIQVDEAGGVLDIEFTLPD